MTDFSHIFRNGSYQFEGGLLIASDIHIREPGDPSSQCLAGAIEKMQGTQLDAVFLLGDIFDFFLGGHPFYLRKFKPVIGQIRAFESIASERYFLEGNHEFGMTDFPGSGFDVIEQEFFSYSYQGRKFLFSHGDLINLKLGYKIFRGVLKSKIATSAGRWVPGSILDAYAMTHSKASRSQDKYRKIPHQEILSDAKEKIKKYEADHFVFGHFHFPYTEAFDGRKSMLCSYSWGRPSFLYFDRNLRGFRIQLRADGSVLGVESL